MYADVFRDKKDIHIALDKAVHAALRGVMFKHGLSMQECLNEFARLVAAGDKRAMKIVEDLVVRKVAEQIGGFTGKKNNKPLGDIDRDAMYSIINGDEPGGKKTGTDGR